MITHTDNMIVTRLPELLYALDLLTDDQVSAVEELVMRAGLAEATASNYAAIRDRDLTALAVTAAKAPSVDTAIIKAAAKVPPVDAVEQIAHRVHAALYEEAKKIVLTRQADVAATVNARFDELCKRVDNVTAELGGITSAQQAINLGATEQWADLSKLRDQYSALLEAVTEFRARGVLPTSIPNNSGSHWRFRLPPDEGTYWQARAAGDDGLAVFLADIARQPWVPATTAEAVELGKRWADEAAA